MVKASDRPTTTDAWPLVVEFARRPGNELGGAFHVILEDGNIGQAVADWCFWRAVEDGDPLEIRLGGMLAAMTSTQRGRISKRWASLGAAPEGT